MYFQSHTSVRPSSFISQFISLTFVTFVSFCSNSFCALALAGDIDFEKQVAPILTAHCLRCHNREKSRAGLDLSTRAGALKGSDGGAVLIPGRPEESRLVQRAGDGSMPPETDGRRLTAQEVGALSAWVKGGAAWPEGVTLRPVPTFEAENAVLSAEGTALVSCPDTALLPRPAEPGRRRRAWPAGRRWRTDRRERTIPPG